MLVSSPLLWHLAPPPLLLVEIVENSSDWFTFFFCGSSLVTFFCHLAGIDGLGGDGLDMFLFFLPHASSSSEESCSGTSLFSTRGYNTGVWLTINADWGVSCCVCSCQDVLVVDWCSCCICTCWYPICWLQHLVLHICLLGYDCQGHHCWLLWEWWGW